MEEIHLGAITTSSFLDYQAHGGSHVSIINLLILPDTVVLLDCKTPSRSRNRVQRVSSSSA